MKIEVFREPMLDCKLVVVRDCPLEDFIDIFWVDSEGDAQALCDFQKWVWYIWLSCNKVSLFVHELLHYAHRQLDELNMPLNDHTEELYACFIEYFLTEWIKCLELTQE